MQVEVDVKCMQTNFGRRGHSSFGDFASFVCLQKWPKFPFGPWTIVHGGQKIELAKNFMQVEVDVKCMQTNFGRRGHSSFGDFAPYVCLQKWPKFPFGPWTIVHGGQKIELAKKILCK